MAPMAFGTWTSMPRSEDVAAFFDRQLDLLQDEKNAEVAQNKLLLSNCSPRLLEQKGLALLHLVPVNMQVGMGGRNLVELGRSPAVTTKGSSSLPPHTFRPGDLGQIQRPMTGTTTATKKIPQARPGKSNDVLVEGVVYKVTDSRITIAIDSNKQSEEDLDLPNTCNLVKLANNVTNDRMQKVMMSLKTTLVPEAGGENASRGLTIHKDSVALVNILLGIDNPSKLADVDDLELYDTSLNDSQRRSVRFAIGCKDVACIHGPPGTGKTHTLLEIIRQSLYPRYRDGSTQTPAPAKRILVCGASNLAVDNLLERLLLPPLPGLVAIRCTRVGHPARVKGQASALDATLDTQTSRSDQAELVKDIKDELSESLLRVAGKAKGQKGRRPRGEERRNLWDEIKHLRQEFRRRERGIVGSVLSEAQVVLATCHSAGGRMLEQMFFDVVIIDEASQALEAACWIPIIKGRKLILAGDPSQLPPTVLSQTHRPSKDGVKNKVSRSSVSDIGELEKLNLDKREGINKLESDSESSGHFNTSPSVLETDRPNAIKGVGRTGRVLRPPEDLSTTLFERLEKMHGSSIKRMLEIQYRMHDKICEFPSKMLYGSRLRSDKSVSQYLLRDLDNASNDSSDILTAPLVFLDTSGCEYFERSVEDSDDGSKYNENEAMVVKSWLEKLINAGIYSSQIAIITPYQAQVTYISSLLAGTYGSELEIGTVDGMQGREKEAIIITLVRSNDKREVGFLRDKRRLNVAMTRARRHLCVIGDSSTVQHGGKFLKSWMEWLEESADVYYGGLEELP